MNASDLFRLAITYYLIDENYTQVAIAKALKIDPQQLNGFLKKRRNFSEERKEKIAEILGTTYLKMLNLGNDLYSNWDFYLYEYLINVVLDVEGPWILSDHLNKSDQEIKQIYNKETTLSEEEIKIFLAHYGGGEPEEFVCFGKRFIEGSGIFSEEDPSIPTDQSNKKKENEKIVPIVSEHLDLISEPGFINKEKGLKANRLLIELEKLNRKKFNRRIADIETDVEDELELIKDKRKKEAPPEKNGTSGE